MSIVIIIMFIICLQTPLIPPLFPSSELSIIKVFFPFCSWILPPWTPCLLLPWASTSCDYPSSSPTPSSSNPPWKSSSSTICPTIFSWFPPSPSIPLPFPTFCNLLSNGLVVLWICWTFPSVFLNLLSSSFFGLCSTCLRKTLLPYFHIILSSLLFSFKGLCFESL